MPRRIFCEDRTITTLIALALLGQLTFSDFNPPDAINNHGLFTDILSHCPPERRQPERGWLRQTHAHEMVHFTCARITSERLKESFYLGKGKCISFDAQPAITLLQVAEKVRVTYRNDAYRSYLIKSSDVNNKWPFAVLDEFNAYRIGMKFCEEENLDKLNGDDHLKSFHVFSDALVEVVKYRDPSYKELKKMTDFIEWMKVN